MKGLVLFFIGLVLGFELSSFLSNSKINSPSLSPWLENLPHETKENTHNQRINPILTSSSIAQSNILSSSDKSSTSQKIRRNVIPEELLDGTLAASDEESDLLYLGCDVGQSMKKVGVVIPFIYRNIEQVLENVGFWENEELLPCNNESITSQKVDLIFWFYRALECNPSVQESIQFLLNQLKQVRRCFSSVHFLSPHLPKKLDYYGDGTVLMFYRLFQTRFMQEEYDYIFFMEADVLPTQKGWLEQLWIHSHQISESFWQKGGFIRVPFFLDRGWGSDIHINGNALYKMGDPCFENYLKRTQSRFPHKPFDMAIRAYRTDETRFQELQRFMHKFVYSDFLHNYGDGVTLFSRKKIVQLSPQCFFVHSKLKRDEEYPRHPLVDSAWRLVLPFREECPELIEDYQSNWDYKYYKEDTKEYWKTIYQTKEYS